MQLFVSKAGRTDALKCIAVAELAKVEVTPAAMGADMHLLDVPVALKTSATAEGAQMVFGAQPIVRYLAARAGMELSLEDDEWLEWDASSLGAAAEVLRDAAERKHVTLPLPLPAVNAHVMAASEGAASLARYAVDVADAGDDAAAAEPEPKAKKGKKEKKGGKGKAPKGPAPVPVYIASAVMDLQAGLDRLGSSAAALAAPGPASLCLAVSALVGLRTGAVADAAHPAARAWLASLAASPAFAAALAAEAALGDVAAQAAARSVVVPAANEEMLPALKRALTAAIRDAFPAAASVDPACARAIVTVPGAGKFDHDFQCNNAMQVFSALSRAGALPPSVRSPNDAGRAIAAAIPAGNGLIARATVAGPGFVNLYVHPSVLEARARAVLLDGLRAPPRRGRHVAIDYSSPNIAKDMHVGHLRSTIIGDSISRILEYLGHRISRINHVGDWGTQFGMLLAHLKDTFPSFETETPDISNLTVLYKQAKVRFDDKDDPDFKVRAYKEVVALQSGDETNLRLWRRMVEVSEAMFGDVYKRLGVHPDLKLCGESFYNPLIPPAIADLEARGLLSRSGDALVMFVEGEEVPLMVRKSDGGYGYDSTDLAAIKYRIEELKADWLVYVIDSGQSLHLRLVFDGAKKAGWTDARRHRIDHVGFGIVCGEDRKRFRTRSGETVRLVDLLDKAQEMMRERLRERRDGGAEAAAAAAAAGGEAAAASASSASTTASTMSDEELEETAKAMGYGAVKYFDLKQNRLTDYVFNYERMLSADGDTAIYLQYQYVRMQSIVRKARAKGLAVDAALADPRIVVTDPAEHRLLVQLASWADAVAEAEDTLNPHVLCKWLYDTCGLYSQFNRDCRVIGGPAFESRIAIVQACIAAVATAMNVIGIPPVERL